MRKGTQNTTWGRFIEEFPDHELDDIGLFDSELNWIAEAAERPELSDPLLFFLPHDRREKAESK